MRLKTVLLAAAATSLAGAPIVAQAADRAAAPVAGANALGFEGSATQLIVLAAIVAAIVGGIALTDDDEDPASP